MADQAAKFWQAFENETGEKVEARSIGEWFRVPDGSSTPEGRGLWGLVVLTDKSFRFKTMPNENWMLSLFKRFDKSGEEEKLVDIVIARGDISAVHAPKRDIFTRLFGPAFPRFSIVARGESGEKTYVFTVDPSNGIIDALQKAAPSAAGADAP